MLPTTERQAIAAPAVPQSQLPTTERQAIAAPTVSQPQLPATERQAIAPIAVPSSQLPPSQRQALGSGTSTPPDPLADGIRKILRTAKTIAVVGASDKPGKPSHRVTFYLMHAGFDVYPVNPTLKELGGRPVYPDLRSVPAKIDVVDIFRRPDRVMPVVEEAIAVGAKAVWMQEGIRSDEAAARARAAGLAVVMDRCMMKEHRKMRGLPTEEKGP